MLGDDSLTQVRHPGRWNRLHRRFVDLVGTGQDTGRSNSGFHHAGVAPIGLAEVGRIQYPSALSTLSARGKVSDSPEKTGKSRSRS